MPNVPIFRIPGPLMQEIVSVIYKAPFGCGLSAEENDNLRERIMLTLEVPEVVEPPADAPEIDPEPEEPCLQENE